MVPITHRTTLLTGIDSYRQKHDLLLPTVVTDLRGVCRGYFDHSSLSFFRFQPSVHQRTLTMLRPLYFC